MSTSGSVADRPHQASADDEPIGCKTGRKQTLAFLVESMRVGWRFKMRWLCVSVATAFIGCAGCHSSGSQNSEQPSAAITATRAARDQPLKNPFPAASEVRLFVETSVGRNGTPIFHLPRGKVLNSVQRTQLESLFKIHKRLPEELSTFCFIPHHFFRYYNRNDEVVGELQVCFCCAGIQQSGKSNIRLKEGQKLHADFKGLGAFVRSLGEPTDVQCDAYRSD